MKTPLYILSLLIPLSSCGGDDVVKPGLAPGELAFKVEIETRCSTVKSRAPIMASDFANGNTYGLVIYKAGSKSEYYDPSFNNIKASKNSSLWYYDVKNGQTRFDKLYLLAELENELADIYAYAPFSTTAEGIEKITYKMEDQPDIMYAVQNMGTENKGIGPASSEADRTIKLSFRHAMPLLRLAFRRANEESTMNGEDVNTPVKITKFQLATIPGSTMRLCKEAEFNAATGALTPVNYGSYFPSSWQGLQVTAVKPKGETTFNPEAEYNYIYILLLNTGEIPAESGGMFQLKVWLDNTAAPAYDHPLDIPAGTTAGGVDVDGMLLPGVMYTYYFTIDNYIHFEHIHTDSEWVFGDEIERQF